VPRDRAGIQALVYWYNDYNSTNNRFKSSLNKLGDPKVVLFSTVSGAALGVLRNSASIYPIEECISNEPALCCQAGAVRDLNLKVSVLFRFSRKPSAKALETAILPQL
jgi:hypothetical protein